MSRTPVTGGGGGGSSGGTAGIVPSAASVANVINLSLVQQGTTLVTQSLVNNQDACALWTIPAGVTNTGPWSISIAGYFQPQDNTLYPSFGLIVANGNVASSSLGVFTGTYQYNNNMLAFGEWSETLGTQTRPNTGVGTNIISSRSEPHLFRLINDGTNFTTQLSNANSVKWRTMGTATVASFLTSGTPQYYGICAGCVNGTGFVTSVVTNLVMVARPMLSISAMTLASSTWSITTSTTLPSAFQSGDSVQLVGITYTGTATTPNGAYNNNVTVTGSNTFTLPGPASGTFTLTSGANAIMDTSN